jgi:hypothetical protein
MGLNQSPVANGLWASAEFTDCKLWYQYETKIWIMKLYLFSVDFQKGIKLLQKQN